MKCAKIDCADLVILVEESYEVGDSAVVTEAWLARPRFSTRPVEELVPEGLRRDYREAAAILDLSPRMSAVLSRRILGDLLENYAGLTDNSLNAQINGFIANKSHPSQLRENLHYLREMGDFAAHTQTDELERVIDVDREEAEWTLDVIDGLFDYFIIGPKRSERMRTGMAEKIRAAGRKAIPPLDE